MEERWLRWREARAKAWFLTEYVCWEGSGGSVFLGGVGVETLRSFSRSAGLTTQLTAEGTALLETVFTLTPPPSALPIQHTYASFPTLFSL